MEEVRVYKKMRVEVLSKNMKTYEILQANVLIKKFPPSRRDYKNKLKHKKKGLTLQELIIHMIIKEANRLQDEMDSLSLNYSKTNLVESTVSTNRDWFKGKSKRNQKLSYHRHQNKFNNKIQKPKELCYLCSKLGHKAYQCPLHKGKPQLIGSV